MANRIVTIFLLLSIQISCCYSRPQKYAVTATVGAPWPMPQKYKTTNTMHVVDSANFKFVAVGETCDILVSAFDRYKQIMFGDTTLKYQPKNMFHSQAAFTMVNVKVVKECDKFPSFDMDESYNLTVDADNINLSAESIWGALRGLETLSQIIIKRDSQYYVNETMIMDFPRFKHRGMLIDTSRHFLSVSVIKEHLEAMAQNKFNVLHWHIVDDQSFPYTSQAFPEMSEKGAFPSKGHVYTTADIQDIIGFARLRGIRVIPEFDSPGHTQSWGKGIPNLLTKCYTKGVFNGNYGPIDPSMNSTFDFLDKFFTEVTTTFPDDYVHMGGDEVSFSCWQSNPDITTYMQKMGYGTNYAKLEEQYMQHLLNIIGKKLHKSYIIWQEVIDNGAMVQPDTVVEVWKGGYIDELAKITKLGYKTLLSSCWYLNYISYGEDWGKYYQCDPHNFNGTEEQMKLVIGGETCMWGEFVDNTNLISRFWPRASAVGERLWSAKSLTSPSAAAPRIEEHRCRMVSRGFAAEPLNGPGFCPVEYLKPQ